MGRYRPLRCLLRYLERPFATDATFMPPSRCKQCNQRWVEIDHWGERLMGCPTCNRWQASIGEWCRLAPDDIIALRALKAAKTATGKEGKRNHPQPTQLRFPEATHMKYAAITLTFATLLLAGTPALAQSPVEPVGSSPRHAASYAE